MVWSPFSNLLLYGKTANIGAASDAGVKIGLGSDWAPSGSKNLLGELKVAFSESQRQNLGWSARDILALATRNAAEILNWQGFVGSLEPGKKADLFAISSASGDPYDGLLKSDENSLSRVLINGIPRLGTPGLMKHFNISGESIRVGGSSRILNLAQETADPDVGKLTLSSAKASLADALKNLGKLSADVQKAAPRSFSVSRAALADEPPRWFLALDELENTGTTMRPKLPLAGVPTGPELPRVMTRAPSELTPKTLDPLTVVDDDTFLDRITAETVLPAGIATDLRKLY
jgi:hypothetical protein